MSLAKQRVDLVLEGGGVKGIGHVGALARIRSDYEVERVIGSSAGAIVAAMVAVGLGPDELREELFSFPFRRIPDKAPLDHIPLLGPALSVGFERGIFETRFLRDYLAERLEAYGVRTFGDLRYADADDALAAKRRYKLIVTATDVTCGELLYLPWDYERFGLDPDEQSVADAITASCAIPFYFEPVELRDASGMTHTLVDGGTLSNFPIDVFDRADGRPPRWPTFGAKLVPRLPEGNPSLSPLIGRLPVPGIRHLEALVATLVVGRDQTYLAQPWVASRTIQVDTSGVSAVEFNLSDEQKQRLFDQGWSAADEFLATWDWDAYLDQFRLAHA